jgi:hypothetical protein
MNKRVTEVEINSMDKEIVREKDDIIILSVIDNMVGVVEKSIGLDYLRSRGVEEL